MPWPGLRGYNHQLRDYDLRLATNTALACWIISKEHLNERHQQLNTRHLTLERWEHTNQLELCKHYEYNDDPNCVSKKQPQKYKKQLQPINSSTVFFGHFQIKTHAGYQLPNVKHTTQRSSSYGKGTRTTLQKSHHHRSKRCALPMP